MDMKGRRLVLFIDAGMDTPAPYSFYRTQTGEEAVLYSHALAPDALLKVYQQFYQASPPDCFVLCVKGESFELGEPPSPEALTNLAAALNFSRQRLLESQSATWDALCTSSTASLRYVQGSAA